MNVVDWRKQTGDDEACTNLSHTDTIHSITISFYRIIHMYSPILRLTFKQHKLNTCLNPAVAEERRNNSIPTKLSLVLTRRPFTFGSPAPCAFPFDRFFQPQSSELLLSSDGAAQYSHVLAMTPRCGIVVDV